MARSHGSSDWLLKMIRSDEIDNFLETIPGVKTLPNMRAPSKDDSTERELKTYLKEYGFDSKKTANIAEWWPKSGPKWDYICQAKINGSDGIILVEAKAHRSESGGKCSAKSIDSRNRIKSALQATHAALAPWQTYNEEAWFTKYYQIANRIAFANKTHQVFGMPILLVFLGFLHDTTFNQDALNDTWKEDMRSYLQALNITCLLDGVISELLPGGPYISCLSKKC